VRRGYKVDEVDSFLDRVEATLNGVPGAHVSSQEVHDVVFRVRFGGYDEWQVDLHLDRVERQLAEMEDRAKQPGRGEALRATERPGPPMGGAPPLPSRPLPQPQQRFEPEPAFGGPAFSEGPGGFDPSRHGKADMTSEIRMPGSDTGRFQPPPGGFDRPAQPPFAAPPPPPPPPQPAYAPPSRDTYGPGPDFDRPTGAYSTPAAPPSFGPPQSMPNGVGGPAAAEVQRVDQLRRTFQLRRFGSGYDPAQVDRLFDGVLSSFTGHSGSPSDSELDPAQFSLVPGGYYEAEVDAALREVRDMVRRR
jgi:DivIVA domain-containing protein